MIAALKRWAWAIRNDTYAVYLSARDPRTPWYAKVLAVAVTAYAFSPIDLIPDFIPVLGYLDDLLITPGGLWLAIRLIPPEALAEARKTVASRGAAGSVGWGTVGAAIVVLLWLVVLGGVVYLIIGARRLP